MNRRIINFLLILTVSPLFASDVDSTKVNYVHMSGSFYLINCPLGILKTRFPACGNNDTFTTDDSKVRLRIWYKFDTYKKGWKAEYQDELNSLTDVSDVYKVFRKKYFVISWVDKDQVYYLKEIPMMGKAYSVFANLEMVFPKNEKTTWDPILTTCANSFKPWPPLDLNTFIKPANEVTDNDWNKKMVSRETQMNDSELAVLSAWYNWGKPEINILENFFSISTIPIEQGGNAFLALEDASEDEDLPEKEREKAQKELLKAEDQMDKDNAETLKIKLTSIKDLRGILNGRDTDFLEWIYETSMIRFLIGSINGFDEPQIKVALNYLGTTNDFVEETRTEFIAKCIEDTGAFQVFMDQKLRLLKDEKKTDQYFHLWNELLKDKIFLNYNFGFPSETTQCQKEMMDLTHQIDLLVSQ